MHPGFSLEGGSPGLCLGVNPDCSDLTDVLLFCRLLDDLDKIVNLCKSISW